MVIHPSSLTVPSKPRVHAVLYFFSICYTPFIFLSGRRQNEKSGSREEAENEELPRGRLNEEGPSRTRATSVILPFPFSWMNAMSLTYFHAMSSSPI